MFFATRISLFAEPALLSVSSSYYVLCVTPGFEPTTVPKPKTICYGAAGVAIRVESYHGRPDCGLHPPHLLSTLNQDRTTRLPPVYHACHLKYEKYQKQKKIDLVSAIGGV